MMYTVNYTERLECWYVASDPELTFENATGAVQGLKNLVSVLMNEPERMGGVLSYIEDYLSDDEDLDSYNMGINLSISREGYEIATLWIPFNLQQMAFKLKNELEIDVNILDAAEEDALKSLSVWLAITAKTFG
jgi:hypothetical protein